MSSHDIKRTVISKSNKEFIPEVVELLRLGHTVTISLRGYSMRPFLEDRRDKAILKTAEGNVAKGDVVLAEVKKDTYVLHRVVSIENGMAVLRGDGNLHTEVCCVDSIYGKAEAFLRKGRDKADRVDGCKWKVYSFVWTRLLPLRRYLLFVYRLARKL